MMARVTGVASHAGTTPMNLRRDAAAAAAEMVLAVERRCAQSPTLVGTVGMLDVPQGATNVVPGQCVFSLDVRAADDATRDAAVADVLQALEAIAQRRGVTLAVQRTMQVPCAPCAPRLTAVLERCVAALGQSQGFRPLHLPSGAGHDAMMIAHLTDIAMLFVRCGAGGISHNPAETMTASDAGLAAAAFLDFARQLDAAP
jgi:hydantoinase/carbamoylase family amidase